MSLTTDALSRAAPAAEALPGPAQTLHALALYGVGVGAYSITHALRPALIAHDLACWLDCPRPVRAQLLLAGPVHDIGKTAVPPALLNKPGMLTLAERRLVQLHCRIGAAILQRRSHPLLQFGAMLAEAHHEWFDGGGYPGRLRGGQIPWPARIFAVADVYDALIEPRPYRHAMPEEKALSIIVDGAGTQFDPLVVDAFLRNLDRIHQRLDDVGALLAAGDAGEILHQFYLDESQWLQAA